MPNIPRVNPGDLVTAAFINSLIDELEDHARQIKDLQSAGVPSSGKTWVTEFRPQRAVRLGTEVEVIGGGFGSRATTTVRLGGLIIDRASVFEDGRIVFTVPLELGPITGLKNVDLVIENRSAGSQAQLGVVLLPREELPSGQFFFETLAPSVQLDQGTWGDFIFTVSVTGNSDQTFRVLPVLDPTALGTAAYVTAGGTRIQPAEVVLRPNVATDLRIRLTIAGTAADQAQGRLALRLECTRNAEFAETSTATLFTVGGTAEAEGPLKVNFVTANPASASGTDQNGSPVFRPAVGGADVSLTFDAFVAAAQSGDRFNIDVGTGAASDPTAALAAPPDGLRFLLDMGNDPTTSPRHFETGVIASETHRTVYVTVSATKAVRADLVVRVTRRSNPSVVWGLFRRAVVGA